MANVSTTTQFPSFTGTSTDGGDSSSRQGQGASSSFTLRHGDRAAEAVLVRTQDQRQSPPPASPCPKMTFIALGSLFLLFLVGVAIALAVTFTHHNSSSESNQALSVPPPPTPGAPQSVSPQGTVRGIGHPQARHSGNLSILFLGNSFTYYNDLPKMVESLSISSNQSNASVSLLITTMYAPGGNTLQKFDQDSHVKTLLNGRTRWDYVVLQEQSQLLALTKAERDVLVYPYMGDLATQIRSVNATPLLFLTWGYKNGDTDNFPGDTYTAMQARLVTGYDDGAQEFSLQIVPVGLAWQKFLEKHPGANLWQGDGKHPTAEGSYLAACVFFGFLEGGLTPLGNSFTAGLNATEAMALQSAAASVVAQNQAQQ